MLRGGHSFAGSFTHLTLRRGHKEGYRKAGKGGQGLDDRVINKVVCSRVGGYFKGLLTHMCRNNGQSPLKTKLNPNMCLSGS